MLHDRTNEADRLAALERRIDELESREAITQLVYSYAEAVRNRAYPRVLDLMAEDCVVELRHADPDDLERSGPIARYAGRDQIGQSFEAQAGEEARVWPMIHNLRIELAGDEARAISVLVSAVWPQGEEYVGEYRDRFRRIDGRWYFASRLHLDFGNTRGQFADEAHRAYQAAAERAAAE